MDITGLKITKTKTDRYKNPSNIKSINFKINFTKTAKIINRANPRQKLLNSLPLFCSAYTLAKLIIDKIRPSMLLFFSAVKKIFLK